MNFKLFVLLLLTPFAAMAANTNSYDNVLIKNNFIFTGGTPGANKVLTSDASGNYTPQVITSINPVGLTNATSTGGTIVITGQGTKVLNLEAPIPSNVVTNNGPNTFTAAAVNTFAAPQTYNAVNTNNATMVISNIVMRGGAAYARSEHATTYTNTIFDYMIVWKGTTASAVTNFLPTGVLNGRTYVIKDGQRSAGSTNIIIKPLGTDTIDQTNQFILNINKQSATITYDGVSNWDMQ